MKPRAAGARSLSPAAKVAAGATAVIAVVYLIAVIVLNVLVSAHLNEQSDARLAAQLTAAARDPSLVGEQVVSAGSSRVPDYDADAAPIFLWAVTATGTVTAHSPGAPELPAWSPRTRQAAGSALPPTWARRACSG